MLYFALFLLGGIASYVVFVPSAHTSISSSAEYNVKDVKGSSLHDENLFAQSAPQEPIFESDLLQNENIKLTKENINLLLKVEHLQEQLDQTNIKINDVLNSDFENYKNYKNDEDLEYSQQYSLLKQEIEDERHKNKLLEKELAELNPNRVSSQQVQSLFPEEYRGLFNTIHAKTREDILDFNQQPQDLDWGYQTEQAILNIITVSQYNSKVKLVSVNCKIKRCEILLAETTTSKMLATQGYTTEEINKYMFDPDNQYAIKVLTEINQNELIKLRKESVYSANNSTFAILANTP